MTREGDDAVAALRANAAFYAAFANGDLAAMDALWAKQSPVLCTHPGHHTLQGRIAVMKGWRDLFDGGPPPIRCIDDSAVLIRGLAFVSCIEQVGESQLAVTNVWAWEDGAWCMVHHHAGAIAPEGSQPPGPPSSMSVH
jgi:hypothetical protein